MIGTWAALLAPALLVAAVSDIVSRTIPDWVSVLLAAAFVPFGLIHLGPGAMLGAAAAAGLVSALAVALFALGLMGGGDVKLLGAGALWAGWGGLIEFLAITAILGGVLALAIGLVALVRRLVRRPNDRAHEPATVPYGVAIAAAVLWTAAA